MYNNDDETSKNSESGESYKSDSESVQQIGKYQIKGTLGKGSLGTVYLGFDASLQRHVAIKVIRKLCPSGMTDSYNTGSDNSAALLKRVRSEVLSLGRLKNPNIVSILDCDCISDGNTTSGIPYLVMQYIPGSSLEDLIRADTLPSDDLLLLAFSKLAIAIDHAHSQSILHLDLKPANIVMDETFEPYILDFGLAKMQENLSSDRESRGTTKILGTPAYMSPEQILNKQLNSRSDLFSFAVLVFECLCRHKPFEGQAFAAITREILNNPPRSTGSFRKDLPVAALDNIFSKALAKDKSARYQDAQSFIKELSQLISLPLSKQKSENQQDFKPSAGIPRDPSFRVMPKSDSRINSESLKSERPPSTDEIAAGLNTGSQGYRKSALSSAAPKVIGAISLTSLSVIIVSIVLFLGLILYLALAPRQTFLVLDRDPNPETVAFSGAKLPSSETKSLASDSKAGQVRTEQSYQDSLIDRIFEIPVSDPKFALNLEELKNFSLNQTSLNCSRLFLHKNYLAKITCLRILINKRDSSYNSQIVGLLNDADPLVRGFSAKAIGILGTGNERQALLEQDNKEQSPEVKFAIKTALERLS